MIRALRICLVFVLLAVPAFAQTAATRATLYTEIDTLFADSGADPITPAQLRQSLKNITASSYNDLTDGAVSSTYLPLAGGTLSGNLGTGDGFTISSAGSIALTAGGTNESITLTPSGTGAINLATTSGGTRLPSTATAGLQLYNTAGETTDYERLEFLWTANSAQIRTRNGGTGSLRSLSLGRTSQQSLTFNGDFTLGQHQFRGTSTSTASSILASFGTYTNTATTGTNAGISLTPTYNQASGDAANTDLLVNRTETAIGSGAQLLADFQVGGTSKFKVSNAGAVTATGAFNKVTLTAPATGSTLTIADGKTLTASNTVTLTATDGSTLAIGTGGTLGTAAYTAASAYATSAQGTKADNVGAVNGIVKSNGSATFSAASAGTDYVVPAGNVATATALATARTIGNVSFDGTANIVPETIAVIDSTDASSSVLIADSATGSLQPKTDGGLTYNASTGVLTATGFAGPLTGNVTGDVSGSSGSTTGNAETATALATPRAIYGNNFDGTAALTQIIASTYGGTGNGFAKFSGPTTSEKTFTLPDANATLLYSGGDAGTPSALVGTNISGTAASLTAGTATALATTRTIGGSNFDGTANVTSFPSPGAIGGSTPSTIAATAIGIGTAPSTDSKINITSNTTSATPTGVWNQSAIQSTATTYYYGFISYPTVADAAFTLPILTHFSAYPNTYGAGATVSVQTGFEATEGLVGGVLNYGFRGRINDQSGAYNLYMDGTAKNYLAGVLQTGSTIELGHASDTTVARVSAGLISVEGVNVATETYAQTAAKATKLGSHASPDTTGGAITWATSAVYEVWTNTTTEYDLPAASGYDGKAVIFYVTGTNAITIDPNSSEVIVRDGTAQTGGVTLTLAGVAGNYVCLICDGTRWISLGYKGVLAAGS